MKNIWNLVVTSSADPKKTSLMIKGIIGTAITYFALSSGLVEFSLPIGEFESINDALSLFIEAILAAIPVLMTAVSAWATLWGGLRKVLNKQWSAVPVEEGEK